MHLLQLLLGTLIIVIVLLDVFQSIVIPCRTPRTLRLSALISRNLWKCWCWMGRLWRSNQHREHFLSLYSLYAPLMPMITLLGWVVTLIFGYGFVLSALGTQIRPPITDFGSALYLAGTSL